MAHEPVRVVALRLLSQVIDGGGNSSFLFDRARFRTTADRGLAMELVFGTLRHMVALDHLIAACSTRPVAELDAPVRNALRLGVYQLVYLSGVPDHAAVSETVGAAKKLAGTRTAGFVNGVLRAVARQRPALPAETDGAGYVATTLSLPRFLLDRWTMRFGYEATRRLAESAQRTPAMHLRVVTQRATRDEVIASLAEEGIEATPGAYLDESIRVVSGRAHLSEALREGLVIVQDEAAQLVARLVEPGAGQRVLDVCAAPGGKAIAIADLASGEALVVAADSHPGRMARSRGAFGRTTSNVAVVAASAMAPPFTVTFDRVLVDAPCTGTGTIRRNPEIRYRVDAGALERSKARATAILDGAAGLLAPGGRLVYATCSLEPEENEEVVEAFLARQPAFRRGDPRSAVPEAAHRFIQPDGVVRTQPEDVEIDGFTAVVLERAP